MKANPSRTTLDAQRCVPGAVVSGRLSWSTARQTINEAFAVNSTWQRRCSKTRWTEARDSFSACLIESKAGCYRRARSNLKVMWVTQMQQCPWCNAVFTDSKLFSLDDRVPAECKKCRKLVRNSRVREVAALAPSLISLIGIVAFELHPAFWLIPLVLYPFSKMYLAKPVKAEYEDYPCVRCKRLDVGFRSAWANVCDDCLTQEEKRTKKQPH
jgi:hypothetical protein